MKYDEVSRVELPKWLLATVFLLFALLLFTRAQLLVVLNPNVFVTFRQ